MNPMDFSRLRDPSYYRPPVATRTHGFTPGVPSQDVSQFKAVDPPSIFPPSSVVESGQTWLATHPSGIGFVCGVASMVAAWGVVRFGGWFVGLPDGGRRQAVVALLIAPSVTTLCVWAWRRLR